MHACFSCRGTVSHCKQCCLVYFNNVNLDDVNLNWLYKIITLVKMII